VSSTNVEAITHEIPHRKATILSASLHRNRGAATRPAPDRQRAIDARGYDCRPLLSALPYPPVSIESSRAPQQDPLSRMTKDGKAAIKSFSLKMAANAAFDRSRHRTSCEENEGIT
jgi:hypothetical protein